MSYYKHNERTFCWYRTSSDVILGVHSVRTVGIVGIVLVTNGLALSEAKSLYTKY